jgi:hypothetical protein
MTSDLHQAKSKRHAVLRGHDERRVLATLDDDDFALMKERKGELVCPYPGCNMQLWPVDAKTRHLRFAADAPSECLTQHAYGGGGRETTEHQWMKRRIWYLVTHVIGRSAAIEDYRTRSDVLVVDPRWSIEVQRVHTDWLRRTEQRHQARCQVLWILTEGARSKSTRDLLFTGPAVRSKVVSVSNNQPATPWDSDPCDDKRQKVHVRFFGTVVVRGRDRRLGSGSIDGITFLKEILDGDRVWHSYVKALDYAGWVRHEDFEESMRTSRRPTSSRRVPRR